MASDVLIFAIGNESRGDDALGPLLLRGIEAGADSRALQPELLEDFQLQIEHSMDMHGKDLVLFVDAGMDTPSPYAFYRANASEDAALYTHALTPEALLRVYAQMYGETHPDCYVLCIAGISFELGEPLSNKANENLMLAYEFAENLLTCPDASYWDNLCTQQALIRSASSPGLTEIRPA